MSLHHPFSFAPYRLFALTLAVVAGSVGCDSLTGSGPSIAGSWSGVIVFSNGFTTSMDLVQNGSAISGEMRTSAGFISGRPITGEFDSDTRTFTWTVNDDCEEWSGTSTLSADDDELSGPVMIDRDGCAQGSDSSGSMTLSRD